MRLQKLDSGHDLKHRFILGMIKLTSGHAAPDVVKTIFYRTQMFGKPFSAWLQQVLRGPSKWTVGERELFAAYTSRLNQCLF